MVLKTGNEDMEKIHLHSQTREKAVIAAVKVVVDIISEGDQDAEQMIFRQIQNTLGVSGAGRKGDFAARRVFTSAIKIK